MATQELNRDIKRLWKQYNQYRDENGSNATNEYFAYIDEKIKPELKRLYYADTSMKSLSANSMRWLLRLNLSLRVIPFHHFGLSIE